MMTIFRYLLLPCCFLLLSTLPTNAREESVLPSNRQIITPENVTALQQLAILTTTEPVEAVAVSEDGKYLAASLESGAIQVWDLPSLSEYRLLVGHTARVMSLVFSSDGTKLYSGSWDQTIRIWNLTTGESDEFARLSHGVWSLALSPDERLLASASQEGEDALELWNLETGSIERTLLTEYEDHWLVCITFSPDGSTVATCNFQGIRFWDVEHGSGGGLELPIYEPISLAIFSPDGSLLAVGPDSGPLQLWNIENRTEESVHPVRDIQQFAIAFNPSGSLLANAFVYNTSIDVEDTEYLLYLLNVQTQNQMTFLRGHTAPISSVTFSSDGSLIFSGSWDKTVRLWGVLEDIS